MPAMWRIVVLTYFQLCVNTCVIGIGSTKSTKTSMYPEFREFFFSHQSSSERPSFIIGCKQRNGSESFSYKKKPNKLFHSPGDLFRQYFDKTTWKLRRTRIHQLKRENWQKRETEIEKNRQNWRNILPEEECYPDPRDEVIEFDEKRNA